MLVIALPKNSKREDQKEKLHHEKRTWLHKIPACESAPRSDKRVRKCRFGHSELLVPTEEYKQRALIDVRFKTVHSARAK